MNLNQSLLLIKISVHGCSYAALCMLFLLLDNVTMHNEGVYIPFPSFTLKQSNLEFKIYLPTLTTLNAFYLLRMRAKGSRSIYNLQVCLMLMTSFNTAQQLQGNFKIRVVLSSCPFRFHVGSLDVGDAPASRCSIYIVIHGNHQILPQVYRKIFQDSLPYHIITKERN
jgi:hypothetical protein